MFILAIRHFGIEEKCLLSGVEADWTAGKVNQYKVTAADGTTKIWSITIQSYVLE